VHSIVVPFIDDRLDLVQQRLDEIEPMLAGIDDPLLAVHALRYRAQLQLALDRPAEAVEPLAEAVRAARAVGSAHLAAALQGSLGQALARLGRFAEAEALLREALPPLERIGSGHVARVLNTLAMLVLWRSSGAGAAEAADLAARALTQIDRLGQPTGISAAADTLGQALLALGRAGEARALFERAASLGGPIVESGAKLHLALLDIEEGRLREAYRLALDLLESAERDTLPSVQREAVLLAASLAARQPAHAPLARHWLRALLADAELAYDERRRAEALLASLPQDGAAPAPAPDEPIASVREFLTLGAR
jgi:tetratricopeptide (TPR) repeat protein